jgi:hypothetical protein
MAIGFYITLKMSKGGATAILKMGEKTGKAVIGSAGSWARKTGYVTEKEGAIRKKMESTPGLNRIGAFKPGSWNTDQAKRIENAKKKFSDMPDTKEGAAAVWKRINQVGTSDADAIAGLHLLADRNALPDDPRDQATQDKLRAILERTANKGLDAKTIIKSRPELAEHLISEYTDPVTGVKRLVTDRKEKIKIGMGKLNPNDSTKSVMSLMDDDVVVQTARDGRRIKQMGRNLEPEKKKLYKRQVNKILNSQNVPNGIWSTLSRGEKEGIVEAAASFVEDPNWH